MLSTFLKPVLVLLISILVFAGAAYLAENELLDYVQTMFFNPSIINSYVKENIKDAEISQNHIFELRDKFAHTLDDPAVQRSFLYNQSDEDIFERSRIYGMLLESTGGLQQVQFVDSNGLRIHYSTSFRDIILQSADSTSYRNYNEDPTALPYDTVSVLDDESGKIIFDEQSDRMLFSFPFIDSMDVYHGTAIFYVSAGALAERLIAEGSLKVSDDISLIGSPSGVLFGSPGTSKKDINEKVSVVWSGGGQGRIILDADDSGMKFSLISYKTNQNIFFGRLVNDAVFSISESMKKILYLSMFLTFYLALYLIINFRPNSVTVVRNRIKRLRENLFEQLYVNKSNKERAKWILELEQRREEIRRELKGNLKFSRRAEKNINDIIDQSWDELLIILKTGSGAGSFAAPVENQPKVSAAEVSADASTDVVEELLEEVEELLDEEEEEAAESEVLEEIEEIEDAELLEDVEAAEEAIEEAEAEIDEEIEEVEAINEVLEEIEEEVSEKITEEIEQPAPPARRGLLALAIEIEENLKRANERHTIETYSVKEYSGKEHIVEEHGEEVFPEFDIVSPFASMDTLLKDEPSYIEEDVPTGKKPVKSRGKLKKDTLEEAKPAGKRAKAKKDDASSTGNKPARKRAAAKKDDALPAETKPARKRSTAKKSDIPLEESKPARKRSTVKKDNVPEPVIIGEEKPARRKRTAAKKDDAPAAETKPARKRNTVKKDDMPEPVIIEEEKPAKKRRTRKAAVTSSENAD